MTDGSVHTPFGRGLISWDPVPSSFTDAGKRGAVCLVRRLWSVLNQASAISSRLVAKRSAKLVSSIEHLNLQFGENSSLTRIYLVELSHQGCLGRSLIWEHFSRFSGLVFISEPENTHPDYTEAFGDVKYLLIPVFACLLHFANVSILAKHALSIRTCTTIFVSEC